MSDEATGTDTSMQLLHKMHALEVKILQGLSEQQAAWRTELSGIDRRFQTELHKMMLDVNAKLDAVVRESNDARAKFTQQLVQETVGKRGEDYRALFLAALSFIMTSGMAVLQFMGARLAH